MDENVMPRTRDHEALADLVAQRLLTVKEIAFACGLATNYVYEYLNGRRNPTARMFNDILRYAAIWADGKVDRNDGPEVAELNIKIPLLMNSLLSTLQHINRAFEGAGSDRGGRGAA